MSPGYQTFCRYFLLLTLLPLAASREIIRLVELQGDGQNVLNEGEYPQFYYNSHVQHSARPHHKVRKNKLISVSPIDGLVRILHRDKPENPVIGVTFSKMMSCQLTSPDKKLLSYGRCNGGFKWDEAKKACVVSADPKDENPDLYPGDPENGGNDHWQGEYPETDADNVCGARAIFPTSDRCWAKWLGVPESELCDVKNGGVAKSPLIAQKMFTKGFCNCDGMSEGTGFNCYSECTKKDKTKVNCPGDRMCRRYVNGTLYCGCAEGFQFVSGNGGTACVPIQPPCESCQYDCHITSKCIPLGETSFVCSKCNPQLGFEDVSSQPGVQPGKSCRDVDECARDHECDRNAQCVNQEVLSNAFHFKYSCVCKKGWRGMNSTGTKCHPCRDENECKVEGICGPGAECRNTEGSYICNCKDGYQKGADGKCHDIDECVLRPCHRYATCTNTEGSYNCTCVAGFRDAPKPWVVKPQVDCELDPAVHCAKCDNATTNCVLEAGRYQCQCKKDHVYVDGQKCKPKEWCVNNADCAPAPKGKCIELVPLGSGYRCECQPGYEGDGKKCSATNVCNREAPCALVAHADCLSPDGKNYFCQCEKGFVRQLAEESNRLAPCYSVNSSQVNNCSICDPATQVCKPVLDLLGQPDPNFKTCYCKDGYEMRKDGKPGCVNINECQYESMNNCDPIRGKCVDKVPHLDGGKTFECKCQNGYKGDGTRDSCKNIDECTENKTPPCAGQHMKCVDSPGSYQCVCDKGYTMIAGMMVCLDVDECKASPCPANSQCFNKDGTFECKCAKGFKSEGELLPKGSGKCVDVDECKEFPVTYKKSACNEETSTCRNTPGSWECECKRPFYKAVGEDCEDVDECADGSDNCDKATTTCGNIKGGYQCKCKKGYERPANSTDGFACKNIDECANGVAKCNANSECVDLQGGYYCKCEKGFKESTTHFDPIHPVCVRDSVCSDDKCTCGSCVDTDKPPYYKCICPYGSFQPTELVCLGQKHCDKDYPCGDNGKCVDGECVCDENYEWITFPGPYTNETMKERPGCQLINLCDRQGCPTPAMKCTPLDTHPFKRCECPLGFKYSRDLVACIDIDECTEEVFGVTCPDHSRCVNYNGTYGCDCEWGFSNANSEAQTRAQNPLCVNDNECEKGTHNCTKVPNSVCKDLAPGFSCECKPGYFKTTDRTRSCGRAKNCLAETCMDIDECKNATCPQHAKCHNTDGSYYCECDKGYRMENGVCVRVNYCKGEGGGHNCTRFEVCCLTDDFFKCDCQKGYERNPKFGNCTYIPICGTDKDTCKTKNMKCVDDSTNGITTCQCKEHQKYINGACIDIDPCTFQPCPTGSQNLCVNDKTNADGYRCDCAKDYKKNPECATAHPNNCSCIPEDLCVKYSCPKDSQCQWKDSKRTCVCNDGYQMNPMKEECLPLDGCKLADGKPKCSPVVEECQPIGPGKARCVCSKTAILVREKCIANPCNEASFKCPTEATKMQTTDSKGVPICVCQCPEGKKFENGACVAVDVCGCLPALPPCKNTKVCPSPEQECRVWGGEAHCECPIGFEYDEKTKTCPDYDECKNNTFCPPTTKCTNLPGSYKCTCLKRGQIYDKVSGLCIPDSGCQEEAHCSDDVNKFCERVGNNEMYCVCHEPYQGSGLPGEKCTPIDYCALPQYKDVCGKVEGAIKVVDAIGKTCKCSCKSGCVPVFDKNFAVTQCKDIDECAANPQICANEQYTECKNKPDLCGGYECVCKEHYRRSANGKCERIDYCKENKVDCGSNGNCEPNTGSCICNPGYQWDHITKQCSDINECNTWPCREHEFCQNTIGSFECVCEGGFIRKTANGPCEDENECENPKNPCPEHSTCVNLKGGFRCQCENGYLQNGEFDCAHNSTVCETCPKNSHCLRTVAKDTIYNCTCNDGFRLNGAECQNIDECKEKKPCHVNATCTDLTPGYSCQCNKPLIGDGVTECTVPDFCDPSYGFMDCPTDSKCVPLWPGVTTADNKTHYVTCKCTSSGLRFNETTRTCQDIDECKEDPANVCPKQAVCQNTIGGYNCKCPAGYKWEPDTNKCDNINECLCPINGCYDKNKCGLTTGRCQDTDGSWICICEKNFGHPKGSTDNQTCERITYCGTELDDCDKKTTDCKETSDGFVCACKSGLHYVPNTNNKKCEDINECMDGTNTCDGPFQQCTNTYGGFYCNCTNDVVTSSTVAGKLKCAPTANCSTPIDCGPYGFAKEENGKCVCKCMNRYEWNLQEKTCIPVGTCEALGECPLNSVCRLTQRQNETQDGSPNALGTYAACVCNPGYVMKNFQCHQISICEQQPTICGNGKCLPDSVEPYKKYTCSCNDNSKAVQTPDGVRCEQASCDTRNPCDPNTGVCSVVQSSVRCDCKPGYEGVGTIESPCLPIKICELYNPCSKFAHCTEANGVAKCDCNKGYTGNGTWCKDVDECATGQHDCFPGGQCTNTQGSYQCKCPEEYEGDGKTCTPIKYCANKIDKCDRESTNCQDEYVSYSCKCKAGFQKIIGNKYRCENINECVPQNPCPLHAVTKQPFKCIDSIGSYSCQCSDGYVNIDAFHCKDIDECLQDPCLANSECVNKDGTFECLCDDGYNKTETGKGPLDYHCDIFPICDKQPDICDRKTSKCEMIPNKPAYTCTCLPGYAKADEKAPCKDINECETDEIKNHLNGLGKNVTCKNNDGGYELECKTGYKTVESKETKLLVCGPINECATDPAWAKALKVIEEFKQKVMNKQPLTMNDLAGALPKAEVPDSPYAKCLATQRFPMCVDLDYDSGSNAQLYEEESPDELKEFKGFGCRCADGSDPQKNGDWMECQQSICRCLGENVDPKCVNGVPGQCQCRQDPVKKFYRRIDKQGNLYCSENQCDTATNMTGIKNGLDVDIQCMNGKLIVPAGWEIIESENSNTEYIVRDINECAKSNPCCDAQNCEGPACVKCFNTPGSYECRVSTTNGDFKCVPGKYDAKTCLCAEAVCNVKQAWFYSCTGCNVTSRTFANDNRPVCSNILKEDLSGFQTFKSLKELLAHTCDAYLLAGQGYCAMNLNANPDDASQHPTFNYYGECNESAAPKCEAGVTPSRSQTISSLAKELYICYYAPTYKSGELPAGATTSNVISTVMCQNQYSSKNWAFQQVGQKLEQKKVKVA